MRRQLISLTTIIILTVLALQLQLPTVTYAQSSFTSQLVTLTCTGAPCNWGSVLSGQAIAWPAEMGPVTNRLGYTASSGIYLPANAASGMTISIVSGTATVYAGLPNDASHRTLATLTSGQSYLVTGLAAGEVVSAQNGQTAFTYTLTTPPPATATPTSATPTAASATSTPVPCIDPTTCNPVSSVPAFWRCNIPGCTDADWVGSVIAWPSWSAFEDNNRTGNQSRTVYSAQGDKVYAYMGSWANGCQVTGESARAAD